MGFDRGTDNQWAFLLIMLHTGTMLSVLVYFRSRWKALWKQWPSADSGDIGDRSLSATA